METISDCLVLIARRMGQGAFNTLDQRGIKLVLTDIQPIREALNAHLFETLLKNLDWID